ncbi:MAG: N-acetylglucosamine-6-phosphate deacetylase [Deltaproteobacteria bacterium]|nr:N-acetylglucosamine-6-phosphate deacetylase [Deltaproteobacteria bacterium]
MIHGAEKGASGAFDVDLRLEGTLVVPGGRLPRGVVLVRQGRVSYFGAAEGAPAGRAARTESCARGVITAGLVDLHVHGAAGADASDGTLESLQTLCVAHAAAGTTGLCPTVLTSAPEVTLRALAAIRAAAERGPLGARVLGAHLEGPFLNPAKAGAQPEEHLRLPDRALLREFLAAAEGTLKLVTLAPELPGALELVAELRSAGVTVAMGHSTASYAEALQAIGAGCSVATHVFNAMPALHHREPGLAGAALLDERVVCEVIADGEHLHPATVTLVHRLKGARGVCLVSDCLAAWRAPPGGFRLGERAVSVGRGVARLADGTLAGAASPLALGLSRYAAWTGGGDAAALEAAVSVPARLVGAETSATPSVGSWADLVHWGEGGEALAVWIGGVRCEDPGGPRP